MKKSLIIFAALMIASITGFAASPPDIADYLSVRNVVLNYNGAEYRIDFKEVVFVAHNIHDHLGLQFGNKEWGTGLYWIVFKNGTWLAVNTAANAHGKWDEYQTFLRQNPQFLSIP